MGNKEAPSEVGATASRPVTSWFSLLNSLSLALFEQTPSQSSQEGAGRLLNSLDGHQAVWKLSGAKEGLEVKVEDNQEGGGKPLKYREER